MDFMRENTLNFENHHLDTHLSHLLTASPRAPSQQNQVIHWHCPSPKQIDRHHLHYEDTTHIKKQERNFRKLGEDVGNHFGNWIW